MADGVILDAMSGGDVAAADDVGGVKYQRIKRAVGGDGAATDFLDKLTGQDTFTGTGAGSTRDCSAQGMSKFALQVKQTGVVTSWTVDLQVSLDGTNWVTLVSHTKAGDGDGAITFALYAALFFRASCSALSLGGGTNIIATVLGLP